MSIVDLEKQFCICLKVDYGRKSNKLLYWYNLDINWYLDTAKVCMHDENSNHEPLKRHPVGRAQPEIQASYNNIWKLISYMYAFVFIFLSWLSGGQKKTVLGPRFWYIHKLN